MAKALYQSLFDWTVTSVNMALAQRTRDSKLRAQVRPRDCVQRYHLDVEFYRSLLSRNPTHAVELTEKQPPHPL